MVIFDPKTGSGKVLNDQTVNTKGNLIKGTFD